MNQMTPCGSERDDKYKNRKQPRTTFKKRKNEEMERERKCKRVINMELPGC